MDYMKRTTISTMFRRKANKQSSRDHHGMCALLAVLERDVPLDDAVIRKAAAAFGVSDKLQRVIDLAHQVQRIDREKFHPTIPEGAALATYEKVVLADGATAYYLVQDYDELCDLRAKLCTYKAVIRSTVYGSDEWEVSFEQQWEEHLDEGWIEIGRCDIVRCDETDGDTDGDTDDEWEFLSDEEDENFHPVDVVRSALEARRKVVPRTLPRPHPMDEEAELSSANILLTIERLMESVNPPDEPQIADL